ncbi:MAG: hypothetical protein ACFFDN_01280 [Candidatus Hodarchaeota archaeon]
MKRIFLILGFIFIALFASACSVTETNKISAINKLDTKNNLTEADFIIVYDRYGNGYKVTEEQLILLNSPLASIEYKREIMKNTIVCSID